MKDGEAWRAAIGGVAASERLNNKGSHGQGGVGHSSGAAPESEKMLEPRKGWMPESSCRSHLEEWRAPRVQQLDGPWEAESRDTPVPWFP